MVRSEGLLGTEGDRFRRVPCGHQDEDVERMTGTDRPHTSRYTSSSKLIC